MASRYLCGVPKDECEGASVMANNGVGKALKAHGSPEQAFKCYKHYLLRKGYTMIGSREFSPPGDNGPVIVLNKKSHFGGRLRPGKSGEASKSGSGNRFIPTRVGKKGVRSGLIVVS